ncbi:MAG: methyltransferase domain-containing protein [Chloroflexi bacterium]|nr:methyltransferase domain-containing protein [Chloroflexota bacterium]
MNSSQLILKPDREKSLIRRHPWIFSGAIDHVQGDPQSGQTVDIYASDKSFIAQAAYSPQSQIRARVWSWDPDESIDPEFFRRRLTRAIRARDPFQGESNALRLVYAESDGFPGLIVDRYAEQLVVQFLSAGAELWRDAIADLLLEITGLTNVYERSDVEVRNLEGLPPNEGPLRGVAPTDPIAITENGLQLNVDIAAGHKTGFYLDQRRNRLRVRELSNGKDVLDGFGYTGGFAVNALKGGAASVTLVEDSADALDLARANIALNDLPAEHADFLDGDMFEVLRTFRDSRRDFDLIILDPPKFAPMRAHAEKAARAYKDVNLLAFKLLRPGGRLVTFSCSGGVGADLFQKIVAGAALDAHVDACILERLAQSPDHPVALNFPEGDYLTGLICEIN